VAQRVYGLALGYEDLNDHEELRNDRLLGGAGREGGSWGKSFSGKEHSEPAGTDRRDGQSEERYKKIVLDHGAVDRLLLEVFLEAHREEPKEIILDLDATDDSAAREAGGALFPWLLWSVLLFAIVRLLRRVPAVRAVAIVEHRCVVREPALCASGDMENRIKEQLMLFRDRTSTHYLRSNQLRLYFSSIAYVLLQMLRRLGLQGTELAKAQCSTVRLKLLKIGALIRITIRKVWISLAGDILTSRSFSKSMKSCALCR
jgi:Transposase DDE domain group 1